MCVSIKFVNILSSPSSHRIAHMDKEAETKSLFKLKPALNFANSPADMSKARSVPMEIRELPPIAAEKFATGSYLLKGFRISPIPPATAAKPFSHCSSTC